MLKNSTEVGKWLMKLESLNWAWKESMNLVRSIETFQLRWVPFNFARFFPTSLGSFQLEQKLSNFPCFPTALSNYTYSLILDINYNYNIIFWKKSLSWKSLSVWNDKLGAIPGGYCIFCNPSGRWETETGWK